VLNNLTIKKFHQGLVNKKFSVREIVQEYFHRIENLDRKINAYLSLRKKKVLKEAEKIDQELKKYTQNILAGVPLAVKDNILIKGERTTAGSRILENYIASYDATVIKKLKQKKVIFLGKTNLDEFAMGSSCENSGFKITRNPYNLDLVPGGSSGGSCAAVAADLCLAALGSDTGGSIRQPSGFCGVVGLKPTYGRVSRFGLIALASSLDQIGPITKTVEDAEILFKAISGKDNLDSTTIEPEIPNSKLEVKSLTIGIPDNFLKGLSNEVENQINKVINRLKASGINFRQITLPHSKYAIACYYIIMPAEACSNLARYDGIRYGKRINKNLKVDWEEFITRVRIEGFGDEVKRRIILGNFVLSHGYYQAYYLKAQKVRTLIRKDFENAFKNVDIILTPTSPTPPFKIGEKIKDPLSMYLSDVFTVPVNLAGLPAISIPTEKKSMIGFQLIGKPFREDQILEMGKFYQRIQE